MKGGGKKHKNAYFVVTNGAADDGVEEEVSPQQEVESIN